MSDREFDIIVYGATGYTGRLVAEYLSQQYGDGSVKWAMAGRSEQKLAEVRDLIGAPKDTPFVIADSNDAGALGAMARRTKVVLTTVGPYQLYGTGLVKACVDTGTDYVDLCGEPAWMHDTIEQFDETARKTGARIVHSCGFDSIPFDMGVYFTQLHAQKEFDQYCSKIRGRVRKMQGTFSGGTAASFMATMARAGQEPQILEWLKDPFSLCPDFTGPKQPHGMKPIYEADLKSWSAPFIMASINTKNVHRSNALLNHMYGENFVYDEMVLTGDGEQGEKMAEAVQQSTGSMAQNPPKPGEGPTKEERENGFYDVIFVGETDNGNRIITSVQGDKDPGYGSTCKMITESALCLALEVDQDEKEGGVYTTAPAMAMVLIDRLQENAGLTFKVESVST